MKRRLIVRDAVGRKISTDPKGHPTPYYEIDLSEWPNANCTNPFTAVVQEQCNLGCWHDTKTIPLDPWGDE